MIIQLNNITDDEIIEHRCTFTHLTGTAGATLGTVGPEKELIANEPVVEQEEESSPMSQHEIRDCVSELWSPQIHLNMLQIPKRNHPGIGTMVSGGDLWTPQKNGQFNGNANSRQLTEKKSSMSLV